MSARLLHRCVYRPLSAQQIDQCADLFARHAQVLVIEAVTLSMQWLSGALRSQQQPAHFVSRVSSQCYTLTFQVLEYSLPEYMLDCLVFCLQVMPKAMAAEFYAEHQGMLHADTFALYEGQD